jgi:predicted nuclease with RNAse H fold
MLTVGVDLSAEERGTNIAAVDWRDVGAVVTVLEASGSDERIVALAHTADKVGIDSLFGWPEPFVEFVNEYRAGSVHPPDLVPIRWRRRLAYRETDLVIRSETGLVPLSVAADRIAHVAFPCAALLAKLQQDGIEVRRSGLTGRVVEVYPSPASQRWALPHRGYWNRRDASELTAAVAVLTDRAPWLDMADFRGLCEGAHDAFDALVAALAARAAALGRTLRPRPDQQRVADGEGWIALPNVDSLANLADNDRST